MSGSTSCIIGISADGNHKPIRHSRRGLFNLWKRQAAIPLNRRIFSV